MFENRNYRSFHQKKGLVSFDITVKETNLNIQAGSDLSDLAIKAVLKQRSFLEAFIKENPLFATSLVPVNIPDIAPAIVQDMHKASEMTGVGPMAAVAGAFSEYTGNYLLEYSREVIVENGGDIFIKSDSDTLFSIFAGNSPLSMKTGISIKKKEHSFALCTSSGTLGHSKSLGKADAATVISDSCCLADAAATFLGNIVKKETDIQKAINEGKKIKGISGIVIIHNKSIGLWGDLELVPL